MNIICVDSGHLVLKLCTLSSGALEARCRVGLIIVNRRKQQKGKKPCRQKRRRFVFLIHEASREEVEVTTDEAMTRLVDATHPVWKCEGIEKQPACRKLLLDGKTCTNADADSIRANTAA